MFTLIHIPAVISFADKDIQAPGFSVKFAAGSDAVDKTFYGFVARSLFIDDVTAIQMVNNFLFDVKQELNTSKKIMLPGLGSITNNNGNYYFEALLNRAATESVSSNKIINKNSEHTIKVGETERTNTQMQEYFEEQNTKKILSSKWLLWAVILTVVAIAAIAVYYFVIKVNGF